MTTLGFGDITFTSDIGRIFSIVVLLSGVVFLLVMLPFLFIRLFYAPWLEARVRLRAPREVPEGTQRARDHRRVRRHRRRPGRAAGGRADPVRRHRAGPDPRRAAVRRPRRRCSPGRTTTARPTSARSRPTARMVLANCEDTTNTNITLTVREVAPDVPVAAIVEEEDSVDVLELSGATSVLPLKHQLGDYLANRVDAGRPEAHVVGEFKGLQIAELPVRDTPFAGSTDPRHQAAADRRGSASSGSGSAESCGPRTRTPRFSPTACSSSRARRRQIARAERPAAAAARTRPPPVLVIGAGKVGQAAVEGAQAEGPSRARDRSNGGGARAAGGRRRQACSPATRRIGGCSSAPGFSRRARSC